MSWSQLAARLVVTVLASLLGGCDKPNLLVDLCPTSLCGVRVINYDWKEDDVLPDGRAVTVTRNQQIVGPGRFGMGNWFTFVHPDTGETVRWNDDGDRETIALMIVEKTVYLLVEPRDEKYGCPEPPYLLYRFDGGVRWTNLPVEQVPIKRFEANMSRGNVSVQETIKSGDPLTAQQVKTTGPVGERYIIDFALMDKQVFARSNCGGPPGKLLIPPYKRE